MVVGWADIPGLSMCVGCCSAAWLQSWLGYSPGGTALILDRLFRPDISPVGADRASVLHYHRPLARCVASQVTRDGGCLLMGQLAMVIPNAAAPNAEPEEWRDCSATPYCAV
jgi:hypothetical protein